MTFQCPTAQRVDELVESLHGLVHHYVNKILGENGGDIFPHEPGFQPATPTSPVCPRVKEHVAICSASLSQGCPEGRSRLGFWDHHG